MLRRCLAITTEAACGDDLYSRRWQAASDYDRSTRCYSGGVRLRPLHQTLRRRRQKTTAALDAIHAASGDDPWSRRYLLQRRQNWFRNVGLHLHCDSFTDERQRSSFTDEHQEATAWRVRRDELLRLLRSVNSVHTLVFGFILCVCDYLWYWIVPVPRTGDDQSKFCFF